MSDGISLLEADGGEKISILDIRPDLNNICSNPIRASIIHALASAKELSYTLSVEQLAQSIGKRHSVIIHHLENLSRYNIVKVVRCRRFADKEKRCIWGLNVEFPNLISMVYKHILKNFFTEAELRKMCTVNKNVRTCRTECRGTYSVELGKSEKPF